MWYQLIIRFLFSVDWRIKRLENSSEPSESKDYWEVFRPQIREGKSQSWEASVCKRVYLCPSISSQSGDASCFPPKPNTSMCLLCYTDRISTSVHKHLNNCNRITCFMHKQNGSCTRDHSIGAPVRKWLVINLSMCDWTSNLLFPFA